MVSLNMMRRVYESYNMIQFEMHRSKIEASFESIIRMY